jgi:TRAP-type C4-dicarboxylate transport system substrate-binding protein
MRKEILMSLGLVFLLVFSTPFARVLQGQPVSGEKMELGLSSTLSPGSCLELACDRFKASIENKSSGRIKITRYPSGSLYGPKAEIEALAKGNIAISMLHNSYVGARSPALEFISSFGAQGCWDDEDHYWRFIDTPEVREIASNEVKAKINGKLLGIMSYGNSLLGNNKRPVHKVEDFKGLKIRTAGSAQAIMYRELGAVPTELSAGEVYMALQRGTIDGANSGPGRFYFSKWYEVTPYITQDYTLPYLSFWLSMNLDTWNKLTEKDQKLLMETAHEVEGWARIYVVKETEEVYEKFKGGLVKELYFLPKSEVARIGTIVGPVMHDLIVKRAGKEMGDKLWSLVEAARKK